MGLADELEKLDQLRTKGALTAEEFAQAKARLLSQSPLSDQPEGRSLLEDQLAELRVQNQLALIDREWDIERRRHQSIGTYGRVYTPTIGMGIAIAVSGSLFGLFWIYTACHIPSMINAISPFPWSLSTVDMAVFVIGAAITVLSLLRGISICVRAMAYKRAYRLFRQKHEQAASTPVASQG